jgi:site-specific DNA-methyltransferase (adenine-specific)
LEDIRLIFGDFLDVESEIEDKSVDLIVADLPYGTTQNKWDTIIPFFKLWEFYHNKIKDNGAIVLFGQDKFSAKLMLSNEKEHRYNLVWKKGERTSGFLNANRMPLRNHEDILVFYKKLPTFNPQFTVGQALHGKGTSYLTADMVNNNYGKFNQTEDYRKGSTQKYPKSLLEFEYSDSELEMLLYFSVLNVDRPHPPIHPTQKPVELLEWLIKTYSNEGELVLDNTMGSGTAGVACENTKRRFIGIEKDKNHFNIATSRIKSIDEM